METMVRGAFDVVKNAKNDGNVSETLSFHELT